MHDFRSLVSDLMSVFWAARLLVLSIDLVECVLDFYYMQISESFKNFGIRDNSTGVLMVLLHSERENTKVRFTNWHRLCL